MGQSTDAYLFYGYTWDEEGHKLFKDDEKEWTEVLLLSVGHPDPWTSYHEDGIDNLPYKEQGPAFEQWQQETNAQGITNREALDNWHKAKRSVEEQSSCGIDSHCSGDYPMPFVYLKGRYFRAWRGDAQEINPNDVINVGEEDIQRLNDFCKALDIDMTNAKGPGWFLVSYWG